MVSADVDRAIMAAQPDGRVIDPEDLRPIDHALLDYLHEQPITPAYARKRYVDEQGEEYTRGYVQERLARLAEHGHAENQYDTGLYKLVNDPRQE